MRVSKRVWIILGPACGGFAKLENVENLLLFAPRDTPFASMWSVEKVVDTLFLLLLLLLLFLLLLLLLRVLSGVPLGTGAFHLI